MLFGSREELLPASPAEGPCAPALRAAGSLIGAKDCTPEIDISEIILDFGGISL